MNKRPTLPPIKLDTPTGRLPSLPPRPAPDDDEIDQAAQTMGATWGASRQIPPPPPADTKPVRLNMMIPAYLDDQLRDRAHEQRRSVTSLILDALSQTGFIVRPEDLAPDRRRRK